MLLISQALLINTQAAPVCESVLPKQISDILQDRKLFGSSWGLSFSVLRPGQSQFTPLDKAALNEVTFFTPASNTKLWATAAAYSAYGPSWRWETPVQVRLGADNKTLEELCLASKGDPSITSEQFLTLAADINKSGVNSVKKLAVDTRYFSGDYTPDAWEFGDLVTTDGALPSAAVVDMQTVTVRVNPGRVVGGPADVVYVGPGDASIIDLVNQVVTTATADNNINLKYIPGDSSLYVTGAVGAKHGGGEFTAAAQRPDTHSARVLQWALSTRGVSTSSLAAGSTACSWDPSNPPANVRTFSTLKSNRLDVLMNHTLLVSDNLYAELFLRLLGTKGTPGPESTSDRGLAAVRAFATSLGVDPSLYLQNDGSGVSRQNLFSPLSLRKLLERASEQSWGEGWKALLPVGGKTGTLATRFIGTPAYGKVHAKTGTLTGVAALSGYVDNANYKRLVFSIVVNSHVCTTDEARAAIDKIVVLLAELQPGC